VGAFFYFQHAQKKQAAENAKKVAIEESERADNKGVKKSVPQDYAKAQEQLDLANKYMDDGDFENAAATYENAKKLFTAAIDHANEVVIARFAGDAEEREKRAQEEARRIREELERAAAEREKALQDQLAGLAKDSEEYKRALEEMAKRKSESERARAVVEKYEPSLCYISVESYVQPEKSTERSVIGKSEGTGFAIGENRIATAKHVVQPWKYDPKLLATAKKIKDEHKLDVKTYLEIYMLKGGKWTKVFESGKDTAKLLAVSKDTWEANERSVTIEWNQVETQLKVKVHDGAADDLAVIEVSGEKLAPVDVEPITTAKKFEPIIVLGTSSDAKKVLSAQVRAEVQDVSADALHLTTPMPANYAGGPLFTLDGKCIALVCGIQGQTVTCLPAQRAANLKGGGSTAPGGAAPGGEAETSGPK
jgi:tetratricopeptide (TPR) repeat protein